MSNKRENELTLVVLIVTIMILLIVAGTTITIVISQNDLFEKAKDSVNLMNNSIAREKEGEESIINGRKNQNIVVIRSHLVDAFEQTKANLMDDSVEYVLNIFI